MIIIGSKAYREDKYYEECFNYIKLNKLSENVIYLGKVEQKYLSKVYQSSDVYVLPTQYDIFGMVYLEAMYFGIPIITTMCGGAATLIENGKNGFIKTLDNTSEWSNIIIKIGEDDKIKEQIIKKSKDKIKEYLWSELAKKFEEEYKKILK